MLYSRIVDAFGVVRVFRFGVVFFVVVFMFVLFVLVMLNEFMLWIVVFVL